MLARFQREHKDMKLYSIIITIILLTLTICYFLKPDEPSSGEKKLIDQRDEALMDARRLQAAYDLKAMHVKKLEGELLESKAVVKRSEQALDKAKDNEKVYLKRIKEQSLKMTDVQADSAVKSFFRDNPDSIDQKVYFDLAKLEQCDSVRLYQSRMISDLENESYQADSLLKVRNELISISKDQISDLYSALDKDSQIISNKDKQVRKLRRQKRLAVIALPVAVVLTIIFL